MDGWRRARSKWLMSKTPPLFIIRPLSIASITPYLIAARGFLMGLPASTLGPLCSISTWQPSQSSLEHISLSSVRSSATAPHTAQSKSPSPDNSLQGPPWCDRVLPLRLTLSHSVSHNCSCLPVLEHAGHMRAPALSCSLFNALSLYICLTSSLTSTVFI